MTPTSLGQVRRIVFLCRVSSPQQAEVGTIASQRAILERELDGRPGKVVAILNEEAVSGRTPIAARSALRELEALSLNRGYDELWMANVDRASRSDDPRTYFHIFGCALDAGAVIYEVKSRLVCDPTTQTGRMWWFMSSESASSAWESIRAATLGGRRRALTEGRPGSSSLTWGILHSKPVGWHFDEKAIATVRLMYGLASTPVEGYPRGLPLSRIRARLEVDGIAPPRGSRWSEGTISRMLRSPVYKGEFRQKAPGEDRHVTIRIPAAVDDATWTLTQEGLASRLRRPTRDHYVKPALLRHMVDCGLCGSTMYLRTQVERYYCRSCHSAGHPMDSVDQAVWSVVSRRLEDADTLLSDVIDPRPDEDAPALEIEEAETGLATLERKVAGLTARWKQDLLTDEDYDRELRSLADRRRMLKQRLDAAQHARTATEAARQQRATLGLRLEILRANIKTADFPTRRSFIETMFPRGIGRIVLYPDRRIELHGMLAIKPTDDASIGHGNTGSGGKQESVKVLPCTRTWRTSRMGGKERIGMSGTTTRSRASGTMPMGIRWIRPRGKCKSRV